MKKRYFLKPPGGEEYEVSKEQYLEAEGGSGFHSTRGRGHEATAAFTSSNGLQGRVQYDRDDDPETARDGYLEEPRWLTDVQIAKWIDSFGKDPPNMDREDWEWANQVSEEAIRRGIS